MSRRFSVIMLTVTTAVMLGLAALADQAEAKINGITDPGTGFAISAGTEHIATGEGNSVFIWGYGDGSVAPAAPIQYQYPGPTLIVNQGQVVSITLTNNLAQPTSMVFPGQTGVTVNGGTPGMLTNEAAPGGGTVTYTFTATHPGTFMYQSGTNPDLQIEMGLFGALIVRPTGFDPLNPRAYEHINTSYSADREYLFLLSEMDLRVHQFVEFNQLNMIDTSDFHPVYWFVNGRTFPDTILDPNTSWLPSQPYNSFVMMHPGDKVLLRVIGGGRQLHPLHIHGNNTLAIAKDGRVLTSDPLNPSVNGADLARSEYTISSVPGKTVDAIFEWTATGLGWDIYGTTNGHTCSDPACPDTAVVDGFDDNTGEPCYDKATNGTGTMEYCPDHLKPLPVTLPSQQALTYGAAASGSPYLGNSEPLPPGHVSINPFGAYMFPWHSHHEKELVNNDIFIGGMLSVLYILPHFDATGAPVDIPF